MPSTFTPNLGIQRPADGEQDGVWGDVINDNMDIIDRAVNGQLTLMLIGTSSTLTTSDGVPSAGQYKMLVLSGTPSGTHTITVAPNDAQKIYFVQNNTAQSVIFTQGSGGNTTILPSDSAVIYCDGAVLTARVQNLTTSLAMAPSFTLPREYGVTGNGTTNDTVNFQKFVLGATSSAYGLIPPAVYRVGAGLVNDATNSRVVGARGAVIERSTGAANTLGLQRAVNVDLEGLTLDGRYDTLATDGHGLSLIDPVDVAVDRFTARDYGGTVGGGVGLLTYTATNPTADRVRVTRSSFEGGVSSKSSALNITNGRYCTVSDSHSYNTTGYGLSFQPGTESSIISSSTGTWNAQSFTLAGTSGSCHNNILGLLASNNSDAAVTVLTSINNVIIGVSAHADTQPDVAANGHAYGVHLSTGADENLALGILASGTTMDYPVRFRSNRSVASVADYSDALKTVTFNAGAQENYVEILHLGTKGTSVVPFIADLNSPLIPKGPGANVIDSPLTRQYFGSINNHFTWSLAGYTTNYAHLSNSNFLFNGFGGNSTLGLGVGDGGEAGMSVSTTTTSGVGSIRYVNTVGAPYWRYDVGGVQTFRLDTTKLAPVTSGGMNLGGTAVPFNQLWVNYISTGSIDVNGNIDTTGSLEVGALGTGDRNALVDFHSSGTPGALDFSARIIRGAGANGALDTYNQGTGNLNWVVNGTTRFSMFGSNGRVYLSASASRGTTGYPVTTSNDSVAQAIRAAGYIEWSTDVGAVGTNYFVSDVRKKENIAPSVQSSADLINQIDFIQFDWKPESGNTGHVDVGVSAQQLQSIDARLVNELSDGGLMVSEPALIAHIAKALQEALAKITALEARVAALEA